MQQQSKFKKTELGKIPEEWQIDKLGNIVNILVGYPFPSKEYSETGIRLVRGDNITEGKLRWGNRTRYWNKITPQLKKFLLQKDDFLIGMDGSKVGKNYAQVGKEDLPSLLVQRVACLRVSDQLVQNYLNYIIGNRDFINYVESTKTNAAIPHISSRQISDYKIILPPLNEQRIIAAILSKVDELIQKTDRIIEITQILKKGLMQRLLTKGIGHTKFKKTTIGSLPTDWECLPLHEIVKIRGRIGWRGYTNADLVSENQGAISLGVNNVDKNNKLRLHEVTYVSWSKYHESPEIQVSRGDIIVAQRGATIGKVAIIDIEIGKATINPNVLLVKDINVNNFFLYCYFDSPLFKKQLSSSVSSTSIPLLTQQQLKSFIVPIPPKNEQNKISQIHSYIDSLLQKESNRNHLFRNQKKGLMQNLLTGKIRVKV